MRPGFSAGPVPIQVMTDDLLSMKAIPTMVGSTLFLLFIVTFLPWAVPLFMPKV
jgi:hypothetical protein